MSRTWRSEPSSKCWLRRPSHIRAKRELLRAEEQGVTKNRRPIPPSDWEDLPVSDYRGQEWYRKSRQQPT